MSITKILADMTEYDAIRDRPYVMHNEYCTYQMYVTGPEEVVHTDVHLGLREEFSRKLGDELLAYHRSTLQKLAKKEQP